MCNNDVALDLVKYEPAAVRSNLFETIPKRLRMYRDVESTCVRNVQLGNINQHQSMFLFICSNKVKPEVAEGESRRILLAVPRETCFTDTWPRSRALGPRGQGPRLSWLSMSLCALKIGG
jgi:hypothetical protein